MHKEEREKSQQEKKKSKKAPAKSLADIKLVSLFIFISIIKGQETNSKG